MEKRIGPSVVLATAAVALAPSAVAQTASAGVAAEVVTPVEITAATATEWLLSNSPGVFALRVPGGAQAGTITVTGGGAEGSSGTFDFFASGEGASTMRQLLAQASSAQMATDGIYQITGTAARGTMNSYGVQLVIFNSNQVVGGSSVMSALITFD